MDYKTLIDQERAKLEVMRAHYSLLGNKIADSENFIAMLENRGEDEADPLEIFVKQQVAANATTKAAPVPSDPPALLVPVSDSDAISYQFPKARVDSSWPYVLRLMSTKPSWKIDELVVFAMREHLAKTESAVRSMMSSLKNWGMVNNDHPGLFSLKPKGAAFVSTLTENQFVLGGAAGTTHSETNV